MAQLPILAHTAEILDAVRSAPVTVLVGATGCGKTTMLCQILHDARKVVDTGDSVGGERYRLRHTGVVATIHAASVVANRPAARHVFFTTMTVTTRIAMKNVAEIDEEEVRKRWRTTGGEARMMVEREWGETRKEERKEVEEKKDEVERVKEHHATDKEIEEARRRALERRRG